MTSVAVSVGAHEAAPHADMTLLWAGHEQDPMRSDLSELFRGMHPTDAAVDLLALAASVYGADKAVLRRLAPDRWTRTIHLHVPQLDPRRWPARRVESLLRHLTGDRWAFSPYTAPGIRQRIVGASNPALGILPLRVALFSGGLDSFAFAAASGHEAIRYVAHKDKSRLAPLQRQLAAGVAREASLLDLRQFMLWVQRKGPISHEPESSTRSRSFLFVAAAVAVATSTGASDVSLPENGFIALNPPLVPGRRGTLTTRTTHPWTVLMFNELLEAAALDVVVRNPFALMTKGDISIIALHEAPEDLVFRTVSCSRPRARRKDLVHFGNCGYCYPCLVRRAGLLAAGVADGTEYRADPRRDPSIMDRATGDDFKALVSSIRAPLSIRSLTAAAPLPAGSDYVALVDVIERSRIELVTMIREGMTKDVRRAVGW